MSNKSQLQTNNTKVASLIEVLKSKATATGEDVTEETSAYTAKIASLETAVTALETELAGKASGGSGAGGANIETCVVAVHGDCSIYNVAYTTIDVNGSPGFEFINTIPTGNDQELACVCGSIIVMSFSEVGMFVNAEKATLIATDGNVHYYRIEANSGEMAMIQVWIFFDD